MIVAFDYSRFCRDNVGQSRLLYIAHREEILKQARGVFRRVVRDGSFGDLVAGNVQPTQTDHLVCTVQSWNSRGYDQFPATHFDLMLYRLIVFFTGKANPRQARPRRLAGD